MFHDQNESEYDQELPQSHTSDQPMVRKSHRAFIVKIHLYDNKSKATSFLFLFKMIAKLEWTQSNAYQNKDKHRTHTKNGKYINQYINNNRNTAFERTAALATGELKCILLAPNLRHRLCLFLQEIDLRLKQFCF